MFTHDDLQALLAADAEPAVSIFLPTHSKGRETRQDPKRLKNLLGQAEKRLAEMGLRQPDIQALLQPALDLLEDRDFWQHQQQGLALFMAPGRFSRHRLPLAVPEQVSVGNRFHLTPLLPVLSADGRFFVIAATPRRVRIFEGARFAMFERDDAHLPPLEAVYEATDYEDTAHASPVGRPRSGAPGGVPKATSAGESPEQARERQYVSWIQQVAASLHGFFAGNQHPVVLAAAPELAGQLTKHAKIKALLPERIDAHADALDPAELHRRAYAIVQPQFDRGRADALAHFLSLAGNGDAKAATRLEEIVPASRDGRVDTLFIARDARESEDLLDLAAAETLLHDGRVDLLPPEQMPRGGRIAAILRY